MKRDMRFSPAHLNSVFLRVTSTFALFYAGFSTGVLFSSCIHARFKARSLPNRLCIGESIGVSILSIVWFRPRVFAAAGIIGKA